MISVLGAVFVLLVGVALVSRRELLPWILSAAVPFSATAGLTVAGQSIVMYHVVTIVVIAVAIHRHRLAGILAADLATKPGLRPLLAFGAWTVAVTAIAPLAFAGIQVLDPREGIDDGVKAPAELAPSISNLAQSGYLLIGIATVVAIGTTSISPRVPAAGFAVGTVLSSLRSLLPESLQTSLLDNSANVAYTSGEFDGVERMRGVFSEPSALGAFSVAAVVFFVMAASRAHGPVRLLYLGLAAWASVNAVLSFSGGALVSGMVVLLVVLGQRIYLFARGRLALSTPALVASFLMAPTVVVLGPTVYAFVTALLNDKAESSSYENRKAADDFSYGLLDSTFGIGVGVGSNRPSSYLASLLSTTGVVGAALFTAALVCLMVRALRDPRSHPVVGALVAIVISKVVSGPDVSEPAMWFLIAVCASAAWHRAEPAVVTREHGPESGELVVAAGRPARSETETR